MPFSPAGFSPKVYLHESPPWLDEARAVLRAALGAPDPHCTPKQLGSLSASARPVPPSADDIDRLAHFDAILRSAMSACRFLELDETAMLRTVVVMFVVEREETRRARVAALSAAPSPMRVHRG